MPATNDYQSHKAEIKVEGSCPVENICCWQVAEWDFND
jgi:hypothetical protein